MRLCIAWQKRRFLKCIQKSNQLSIYPPSRKVWGVFFRPFFLKPVMCCRACEQACAWRRLFLIYLFGCTRKFQHSNDVGILESRFGMLESSITSRYFKDCLKYLLVGIVLTNSNFVIPRKYSVLRKCKVVPILPNKLELRKCLILKGNSGILAYLFQDSSVLKQGGSLERLCQTRIFQLVHHSIAFIFTYGISYPQARPNLSQSPRPFQNLE